MSSFSRSSSHLDSVRSSRVYPASENSHLENEVTDLPHSQVGWKALLSFTTKSHTVILGLSLGLSIASGIVIPTMAIFLGMIFDVFTDFGRGKIAEGQFLSKISTNAFYLVGLGLVSWGLNGGYFLFWLMFGELQAKSARDKLYAGMLEKEIEWYDMRRAGIKAMIPRIQT